VQCILVLEDNVFMRVVLRDKLEMLGYDVLDAPDGESGMRLFHKHLPRLVITDVFMPGKNGLQVITEIKLNNQETKIIAISGGGIAKNSNCLEVAKAIGGDRVFDKPIKWEEFLNAVNELMNSEG